MENGNLLAIFLTGLVTGGLSCMAVQGGLLAATIAQREEDRLLRQAKSNGSAGSGREEHGAKGHALPITIFLFTKLIAYTIFGALLGWLGSFFSLSLTTQIIFQTAVAVFMIGTALNILQVHPIFRYFIIQPPKFITRRIRQESKSNDIFAPALLGALTVLIPCGTTQAMMALAVVSGSPVLGAMILFAFTIGTSPVFFLLGYFATRLGGTLQDRFMRFAAYAILLLAVFNLNNVVSLSGSTVTLGSISKDIYCTFSICSVSAVQLATPVDNATITIEEYGYTPSRLAVKAGSQVKLHLVNNGSRGCASAFTIPRLGIQKIVPFGTSDTVTFTAPSEKGEIAFMCSMGMYEGRMQII